MRVEIHGWNNWRLRRVQKRDYGNTVVFDFRFFAVRLWRY